MNLKKKKPQTTLNISSNAKRFFFWCKYVYYKNWAKSVDIWSAKEISYLWLLQLCWHYLGLGLGYYAWSVPKCDSTNTFAVVWRGTQRQAIFFIHINQYSQCSASEVSNSPLKFTSTAQIKEIQRMESCRIQVLIVVCFYVYVMMLIVFPMFNNILFPMMFIFSMLSYIIFPIFIRVFAMLICLQGLFAFCCKTIAHAIHATGLFQPYLQAYSFHPKSLLSVCRNWLTSHIFSGLPSVINKYWHHYSC